MKMEEVILLTLTLSKYIKKNMWASSIFRNKYLFNTLYIYLKIMEFAFAAQLHFYNKHIQSIKFKIELITK